MFAHTFLFYDYDPPRFNREVHDAPAFGTELVHDLPGQGDGLGHYAVLQSPRQKWRSATIAQPPKAPAQNAMNPSAPVMLAP
jgi:hypothetical protein